MSLEGQEFGDLKVLSFNSIRNKNKIWDCQCSCGNMVVVSTYYLNKLLVSSCKNCKNKNKSSLGMSNTKEYQAYISSKNRCNNPLRKDYKYYGGRGIMFLFKDFSEFYNHIGPSPDPSYSLDRIDNDGNYELGNIRWATKVQQMSNQRCSNCDFLRRELEILKKKLEDHTAGLYREHK